MLIFLKFRCNFTRNFSLLKLDTFYNILFKKLCINLAWKILPSLVIRNNLKIFSAQNLFIIIAWKTLTPLQIRSIFKIFAQKLFIIAWKIFKSSKTLHVFNIYFVTITIIFFKNAQNISFQKPNDNLNTQDKRENKVQRNIVEKVVLIKRMAPPKRYARLV